MIALFVETACIKVQPIRGHKHTRSPIVEDVTTAVFERAVDNVVDCCSARTVSQNLGVIYSRMRNALRKIVQFYPNKVRYNQQLLPIDRESQLKFSLIFLD